MDRLAAHAALRLDAFRRHAAFTDGAPARSKIDEHLRPLHELGEVHHLERDGVIEAVLAWRPDRDSWFGPPVSTVAIDYRGGADISEWLRDVMAEARPRMEADLDLQIDATYVEAYRVLRGMGLGVDSVILLGDVEMAASRLEAGPLPEDIRLEPMVETDLEEVLALFSETFRSEPQYCWFGGDPSYMIKKRERLEELLAKDHDELVVRSSEGVRGHVSATVGQNPFYGRMAGMSLCLHPGLRGRGLLRPIYRRLLEGMRARGAVTFKGGTSQGGVMHLGREMGRRLLGVCFRRGAHFDEAHFAPWVPLTERV